MQPEGAIAECPTCQGEGTLTLRLFDDRNLSPNPDRTRAIHIPIAVPGYILYSYWLSYRVSFDDFKPHTSFHPVRKCI